MKFRFIYTIFSAALVVALFLSNSNGPSVGGAGARTGAPGEGLCTGCHGGGSFGGVGVTIQMLDGGTPVFSYIPGQSYTLRIQMTGGGSCYGAQATVLRNSNNTTAGTLSGASSGAAVRSLGGRSYLEHTNASSTGLFTATWVAPLAGAGSVTIYAAGIACNNGAGDSGDSGANSSLVLTEAVATTISYSPNTFCAGSGASPAATLTGTTSGAFSAPAGLSINPSSGIINLATSTAGTYAVTYTYSGTSVTTTSVTLTARQTADFSYNGGSSFCQNLNNVSPNMAGTTLGGIFSATPAGLSISASTGAINPSASLPNTYAVQYRTTGTCPDTFSLSVQIQAPTDAAFAYTSASYCQAEMSATISSIANAGGTFSAEPAGLSINSSTGTIDLNASTIGTYNVLYTSAGACNDTDTVSITVSADGSAEFSYPSALCSGGLPQTPNITGNAGGVFASSPAGLSISASTGTIDPAASTLGTYEVIYTVGGACSAADTVSVDIVRSDTLTLSFPQEVLDSWFNCLEVFTPTIGGNTTGIFSSIDNTIVYVDTITGEFRPIESINNSPNSLFVMVYQSQSSCPDTINFDLSLGCGGSTERFAFAEMRLYPNPAQGACWLEFQSEEPQDARIEVRDVLGRQLMQQAATLEAGEQRLSVDISELPQGLYWLRLVGTQQNSQWLPLRKE